MADLKCNQCNSTIDLVDIYFSKDGALLGSWPLYMDGKPNAPHDASHYFCGAACSYKFHRTTYANFIQRS